MSKSLEKTYSHALQLLAPKLWPAPDPKDIQTALEKEFGIIELVREPEDWRDIPEYDYGEIKEDEYLEWEEEGGKKEKSKSGG